MMRMMSGFTVGVNDYQEIAQTARSEGDEALHLEAIRIKSIKNEQPGREKRVRYLCTSLSA